MTSLPLVSPASAIGSPVSVPVVNRPMAYRSLARRWNYGRGYAVVAALAPLVLTSLLLVFLHYQLKTALTLLRLQLR